MPSAVQKRSAKSIVICAYGLPIPSLSRASLRQRLTQSGRRSLNSQRDSIIAAYLHRKVQPLLRRWERPEAIRQDLDSGALAGAAVTLRLRTFLQERDRS